MNRYIRVLLVNLSISIIAFLFSINAYSLAVYDGGYDDTGFSSGHSYIKFSSFEYLNPFSGNLIIKNDDLKLTGNGDLNLEISRIYNSKQKFIPELGIWKIPEGSFGFSWNFFFARIVPSGSSSLPVAELTMADGNVYEIYSNNNSNINKHVSSEFITDNFSSLEYNENDDIWKMVLPNGNTYIFDQQVEILGAPAGVYYYPTSIKDTNGNKILIKYYDCCDISGPEEGGKLGNCPNSKNYLSKIPHIKKVIDSTGREINFNWLNNSCRSINTPNVISSIEINGDNIKYRYQPVYNYGSDKIKNYLLTEVIPPEGPGWKYGYEFDGKKPDAQLNRMVLPFGAKIEYQYNILNFDPNYFKSSYQYTIPDKSLVLTSRVISGPGLERSKWKLKYGLPKNLNTTEISYPCGNYEVFHYYTALKDSYSGKWAVSLLYRNDLYDKNKKLIQSIKRKWSPSLISLKFGTSDKGFFIPLLMNKMIERDGINYSTDFTYNKFYNFPTRVVENSNINGQLTRTTEIKYFDNTEDGIYIISKPENIDIGIGFNVKRIKYNYENETGRKISQSIYGVKTEYSYYPDGNLKWKKNANGIFTHFGEYQYGIPRQIKYGCKTETASNPVYTESRVVNSDGLVSSLENGRGYKTNYKYDGMNRVEEIIPPDNGEANTNIEYNKDNLRNIKITKGNSKQTYIYDGLGRLTGTFSNANIRTRIKYDKCGRVIYRSLPFSDNSSEKGNEYTYDALGRITEILHPDGAKIKYEYRGNTTVVKDEMGSEQVYNYKSFGYPDQRRLISVIDSNSNITNYKYDIFGNIAEINSPLGNKRKYTYNSNNFLVSKTEPESGKTRYIHDKVGNIISEKNSNGDVTSFKYDSLNRLIKEIHPLEEENINYSYDNENNILSISSSSGYYNYLYKYDPSNRLISKTVKLDNNLVNYKIKYSYDNKNNISELTYPSGRKTLYLYDTANRISGILEGDNVYLGNVVYNPSGFPLHYNNLYGVVSDFTYDSSFRLTNLKVSRPYPELRIIKKGLGHGTVKSKNIRGIDCGNDCRQVYPQSNTLIELVALENEGSDFVRWSGDSGCSSEDNTVSVTLKRNKTCIATFEAEGSTHKLKIKKHGKGDGSVITEPRGISCGNKCEAEFNANTFVKLKAIPNSNSSFISWSGEKDCIDGRVIMNKDLNCNANFTKLDTYRLSIVKKGSGEGFVSSEPEGISCGNDCDNYYEEGTEILLSVTPNNDSEFQGWTGDPDCKDGKILNHTKVKCIAHFKKIHKYNLSVIKKGEGSGTVVSSPEGILCGSNCRKDFSKNISVRLTVDPDSGSKFTGWSGDTDCSDGFLKLNKNLKCIANFSKDNSTLPPLIEPFLYPEPNNNGWYGKNIFESYDGVIVNFNCLDRSSSGIAFCSPQVIVSKEGVNKISGVVEDKIGNKAETSVLVRIDKTKPFIEIKNYQNDEVVLPENVSLLADGTSVVSVKGSVVDNLSGTSRVECMTRAADVFRTMNEIGGDDSLNDDSGNELNVGSINGSEFECSVSLAKSPGFAGNNVYVKSYDKAGNPSDFDHVRLIYYGDNDTEPPVIQNVNTTNYSCYNEEFNKVSLRFSVKVDVTDNLSGPDFDSDNLTLQGFPIDIDFECTDNGTGTSLCSGGGEADADNIYDNTRTITNFNTRQIQGVYEISDLNGNVSTEDIELDVPSLNEIDTCLH